MPDFDEIDQWWPAMDFALEPYVDEAIKRTISSSCPEYMEDACDLLFSLADREKIIDATLQWLHSTVIIGYHGSRLTDDDVTSIRNHGLVPLKAEDRYSRLTRTLSKHPRWNEVSPKLATSIHKYGQEAYCGRRENQVHLTLSKGGLINSFNHYITHGSEFDQHVAADLLGNEGKELLKQDGLQRVIQVSISGNKALAAAHPFFPIDAIRSRGDLPNIVREFLKAWVFKLTSPEFQTRDLEIDCGMIFFETIPSSWIIDIKTLPCS